MRKQCAVPSRSGLHFPATLAFGALLLGTVLPSVSFARAIQTAEKLLLVVCAPGYPGSTVEAQPAMDALAGAIGGAAGWEEDALTAVYYETEKAGLARLAESDAVLALVPLNFFLAHSESLGLVPRLQAVQPGGDALEAWSLVAAKGAVTGPASLAGFELISLAGNVQRFVRGPALGSWGPLPADLKIVFSGSLLSGLRRAVAGEKVALLLDRSQTAALATLPSAPRLEVVTSSPPLPVSVLCTVGNRLSAARIDALVAAVPKLGDSPEGAEAMAGVRLARFVAADAGALASARAAYDRARD